jgi:hypothetical protein
MAALRLTTTRRRARPRARCKPRFRQSECKRTEFRWARFAARKAFMRWSMRLHAGKGDRDLWKGDLTIEGVSLPVNQISQDARDWVHPLCDLERSTGPGAPAHTDGSCQKLLGGFGGEGRVIPDFQRGAGDKDFVVAAILKLHGRPGYDLDFDTGWRYGHLRHPSLFHGWKPNRGHVGHFARPGSLRSGAVVGRRRDESRCSGRVGMGTCITGDASARDAEGWGPARGLGACA